jgi:hypothetical protein
MEVKTLMLDGWQIMTNYRAVMHHEELQMPKVQYLAIVLFLCRFSVFDVYSSIEQRG